MAKQNTSSETKLQATVEELLQAEIAEKDGLIKVLSDANEELSLKLAASEKANGDGKIVVEIGKKPYVAKFPTVRIGGEVFKVDQLTEEQKRELLAKGTFFEK